MFWFLITLIGWFVSTWKVLPNDLKAKIIEAIISTFVELFRKYYHDYKKV